MHLWFAACCPRANPRTLALLLRLLPHRATLRSSPSTQAAAASSALLAAASPPPGPCRRRLLRRRPLPRRSSDAPAPPAPPLLLFQLLLPLGSRRCRLLRRRRHRRRLFSCRASATRLLLPSRFSSSQRCLRRAAAGSPPRLPASPPPRLRLELDEINLVKDGKGERSASHRSGASAVTKDSKIRFQRSLLPSQLLSLQLYKMQIVWMLLAQLALQDILHMVRARITHCMILGYFHVIICQRTSICIAAFKNFKKGGHRIPSTFWKSSKSYRKFYS